MTLPDSAPLPVLRPLELIPIEDDGESLIVFNDREGIAPEPVVMHAAVAPFLRFFDGSFTLVHLKAALAKAMEQEVSDDTVHGFVRQLDEALLLDSPRFRDTRQEIVDAFRSSGERQPTHAGAAYPNDGDELRLLLDGRRTEHAGAAALKMARITGVIAPHIDYERGAQCYARTYDLLDGVTQGASAPDVFILIGTAHIGLESAFSTLDKNFVTPLGTLPVDREVAADLERDFGLAGDFDLLVHRNEHSLELTATYLAYACGGRPVPIVPVLCGVGAPDLRADGAGRDHVSRFVDTLSASLARHGRRPCFVAGADLAHVGPRFGDPEPVTDAFLAGVERADQAALAAVVASDAGAFAEAILGVDDRYRVCGLGAIYTMLTAQGGDVRGHLIDYGQAVAPDRSQCVSFAGAVFEA